MISFFRFSLAGMSGGILQNWSCGGGVRRSGVLGRQPHRAECGTVRFGEG